MNYFRHVCSVQVWVCSSWIGLAGGSNLRGKKQCVSVCVGGVAVKNMALSTKILMTFPLYLEHVKIKGLFLAISEAGVISEEG